LKYFSENVEYYEEAIDFFTCYKCYDKLEEFKDHPMDIVTYSIMHRDINLFNKWIQIVSAQDIETYKTGLDKNMNILEHIFCVIKSPANYYKRKNDLHYSDPDDPRDYFIKTVLTKIGMKTQNLLTDKVHNFAKIKNINTFIDFFEGKYVCQICSTIDNIDQLIEFWGCDCLMEEYGHAWDPWALADGMYHLECIMDESIKHCKYCGKKLPIHSSI
jgi:hypothetical protein